LKHKIEEPLLLGTVGWVRPDWLAGYYPEDLPQDWRLAYYANDCGCLMLTAAQLPAAIAEGLRDQLEEVGESLTCLLDIDAAGPAVDDLIADLVGNGAGNLILLSRGDTPSLHGLPVWRYSAPDQWVAPDATGSAVRWHLDGFDLRVLRERATGLPADSRFLVIDGPSATPARIRELRTLLELLGRC
jgi:hypothetical protein